MMTIIAYILLLLAALFDLCVMLLRWDVRMQQANEYDNSKYNKWLRDHGELSSPKRLTVLAVLVATCTTMVQMSWMVVVILAAVLLAQGIVMLRRKPDTPLVLNKRAVRLSITAIVITLLAVEFAGYLGSRDSESEAARGAAIVAVMILTVSPLLVMLSNWLLGPIERRINRQQ